MYSKTNKCNFRKRKLEADLIFEVQEGDCSPSSSPEHENVDGEEAQPQNLDVQDSVSRQDSNLNMDDVKSVVNITDTNKVLITSEEDNQTPTILVKNVEEVKVELEGETASKTIVESNDKFLFSVKFRDKKFSDLNKDKIVNAIITALDCDIREESDELGLKIKFWEGKSASDMEITDDSDEGLCVEDPKDVDNLFVVDITPSSNKSLNGQPKFYSRTKYTIEDENAEMIEPSEVKKVRCNQSVCFNCDGPHALKDCKEPKNYRKINMARNKHKEMKSAKNTRYHLEEDQKYGHLKAGSISASLRTALGLGEQELPAHVYHMRRVGYPPGWLQAARRTNSDLALYDMQGRPEETDNSGVISEIDPEKVVVYPGFNAPCPEEAHDEHDAYGCPPYSERHAAKHMLAHLARRVEPRPPATPGNEQPLPAAAHRCDSPSLTELERQKQQLLDMLNNGVSVTPREPRVPLEQLEHVVPTGPSVVRDSSFGTPVLKSLSPYASLPRPENFSQGVSQVINFENLPDSTGKYQQMTTVLSKVRNTIKTSLAERLDNS